MNLLKAENLSIQIGGKKICHQFNIALQPGDIWGILGPNGCGKTTFLHTLAGLISPKQGEIFLAEKRLTALSPKYIARHLGILLQDTSVLFPQTVQEFCLNGRYPHQAYFSWETSEDKKIVSHALKKMELDTKAGQTIQTLSGGERRRLAIATLLTQAPQIYLLDEPVNHLDIRHQVQVLNHFKSLAQTQSAAVMMSLHDVNLASHYCNKLMLIYGDTEIVTGPTKEVLTTQTISRLYQHPFIEVNNAWQYVY